MPGSPLQDLSSNFGSPDIAVPDLERVGARATSSMEERLEALVCRSHNQRQPLQTIFQVSNKSLAVSQHGSPHWKLVQPLLPAFLARQDLGPYLDRFTAPQPQGPMTQGHLKNAGRQDADSINSQVQMMKMLEVPFSFGFLAHNATQACPHGSKRHLLRTRCQTESTAKQDLRQLGSCFTHEPSVKKLWQGTGMMASFCS